MLTFQEVYNIANQPFEEFISLVFGWLTTYTKKLRQNQYCFHSNLEKLC